MKCISPGSLSNIDPRRIGMGAANQHCDEPRRPGLLRSARNDGWKAWSSDAVVVAGASEAIQSGSAVRPMRRPYVYIMASQRNGTLYTGVTSDLPRRVFEHQNGTTAGFTQRYGCKLLVWCEEHATMPEAIAREKQIKGGSRKTKLRLIEASNPNWRDLAQDLA